LKDPIYKYIVRNADQRVQNQNAVHSPKCTGSNCIGVVLDIDSGGGQVSGTPEFYDYIASFKKKPVVAYILMD
jgi:protease-4